jgi:hypothetical protein
MSKAKDRTAWKEEDKKKEQPAEKTEVAVEPWMPTTPEKKEEKEQKKKSLLRI